MFYKLSFIFLLFIIYSIIGWIIETLYNCFVTKKFINRGFLMGPYCPIYGIGVLLILILLGKYSNDIIILFVMSIFICSILEYITSLLMEIIFKNRWWDYSDKKFNINGRICLETMIPFGLIGSFVFYILNPFIVSIIKMIPVNILIITSSIIIVFFIIDLSVSLNIITKFKNISKNIRIDSTEEITKKVKEIILNQSILHRRLIKAFPKMKINLNKKSNK